ncbi:MAG: lipid-binding SYLF domain-containing protein [Proteobacteria bacterium]|nr:lipid-binding SYLF domain-containing protein [Pseudomonadota bacterium]MBU1581742.1 lipid-binding SYLF domain-containing protein [Pseudomonadota bacterium]MBU2452370.1 lipid-binding SYLF domain-containing protein [Pseudomonadota bacterium]MBU2630760.1 lipid-binding SYLF domain-containing protein [Pseudomonadota bacterium]
MKLIKFWFSIFFTLLFLSVSTTVMADNYSKTIDVFNKADAVKPFFKEAYGYAVFPKVGKGGIVVGAAYGSGRVYKQGTISGTTELMKVTIGFQLGGQAFSEIIFFQDKRSYDEFTGGNFEFDGSLSAVAITAAVQAQASTQGSSAGASLGPSTGTQAETSYTKGMAVFIHTLGGLMYEMSVGGQKFTFVPIK